MAPPSTPLLTLANPLLVAGWQYKASLLRLEVWDWNLWGQHTSLGYITVNTGKVEPPRERPVNPMLNLAPPSTTVTVPYNKLMRFKGYLMDAEGEEPGQILEFEVRKVMSHSIPTEAVDPDSKVQCCCSRHGRGLPLSLISLAFVCCAAANHHQPSGVDQDAA